MPLSSTSEGYVFRQLQGDEWLEKYSEPFRTEYSTKDFVFIPVDGRLQLRLVHLGGDFADVEQVSLSACDTEITPNYARYVEGDESVMEQLLFDDLNVVIAQDKEIELAWDIPETCSEDVTVSVKANSYGHAAPFEYMGELNAPLRYQLGSQLRTITVDGLLKETDGVVEPLAEAFWEPSTGHPDGYTYIYVSNDEESVYFSLDITMDNTDELGEDWLEIGIGENVFRVDDEDDQYGKCGFGLTSKVTYHHQTCEVAVPISEIDGDDFSFSVSYYGTGGAPEARDAPILPSSFSDDYYAITMFDTSIYEVWFRLDGTGTPGTRTIVSSGIFTDPPRYAMDIEQLSIGGYVIAYGLDESTNGQGYDLHVTRVTTPGSASTWDTTIVTQGESTAGPDGVSKFIKLVPDLSGGVFVLYLTADIPLGSEIGFVELVHLDSSGVLTFLDSYGWWNADMVADGSGGVYVLYDIGNAGDAGGLAHGSVRHYTSAGMDVGFGTVSVSSDASSVKSGAVMLRDDSTASSGDILVFWMDDDSSGPAPGLYMQRISTAGSVLEATRGALIVNTTTEGAGFDSTAFLRASSGFGFDSIYVAYLDGAGDWRVVEVDSATPTSNWGCIQNFGSATEVALSHEQGISGGTRGVLVVGRLGTEIRGQLYEQSSGESVWDLGQIVFDDSGGNEMALQGHSLYPTADVVTRLDASAVEEDGSNGFDLIFKTGSTTSSLAIDRFTYPAGAGGDCAATPDAITDLSLAAGNTEITASWTEPNDNGDPITQYEVRYGETVGFPGNETTDIVPSTGLNEEYTITGLTNGTEYSVRVFAENSAGLSAASNVETATPLASEGRRRTSLINFAANVYLGTRQGAIDEAVALYEEFLRGSASIGESIEQVQQLGGGLSELSDVVYQSVTGGEDSRNFFDDEDLRSRLPEDKWNILRLLDLLTQLRQLYAFMQHDDYQLLRPHAVAAEDSRVDILRRNFLHLVGERYFAFSTQFREALENVFLIPVDIEKGVTIRFGQVCYDQAVIDYLMELDYPDSPNWFHRYKERAREWTKEVLKDQTGLDSDFVDWLRIDDKIDDPLKAYYQYVFGFCLRDALDL